MINIKDLMKSELFRYASTFVVGITIGMILYPTKKVEERISAKYETEIASIKEEVNHKESLFLETLDKTLKESKEYRSSSEEKISKLTTEVYSLKSSQKTSYYKVIRPDGTIEIKKYSESEVTESTKVVSQIQQEFKIKVDAIEQKWDSIHKDKVEKLQSSFLKREQDYKKQIATLETSKIVEVNSKRFGIQVGRLSSDRYYLNATGSLWGPIFLGLQGETFSDGNSKIGLGVGINF